MWLARGGRAAQTWGVTLREHDFGDVLVGCGDELQLGDSDDPGEPNITSC